MSNSTRKYQVMPPLSDDEYAALREDIRLNGVLTPVLLDEHGEIIDGHNRRKIAAELGIWCPKITKRGLTEDQKYELAFSMNAARRSLSQDQKRHLATIAIQRWPDKSDRGIGRLLGISHMTVGRARNPQKSKERRKPGPKRAVAQPPTEPDIAPAAPGAHHFAPASLASPDKISALRDKLSGAASVQPVDVPPPVLTDALREQIYAEAEENVRAEVQQNNPDFNIDYEQGYIMVANDTGALEAFKGNGLVIKGRMHEFGVRSTYEVIRADGWVYTIIRGFEPVPKPVDGWDAFKVKPKPEPTRTRNVQQRAK